MVFDGELFVNPPEFAFMGIRIHDPVTPADGADVLQESFPVELATVESYGQTHDYHRHHYEDGDENGCSDGGI